MHRDIKPANVLLDGNRSVHVADFGIAQLATEDTLTADGELLGTAAYLAPERAMGRPATDASDRYSLAVVAFELLVGERPFTDQRFAVQARQHVDAPPPSASERNPRLPRGARRGARTRHGQASRGPFPDGTRARGGGRDRARAARHVGHHSDGGARGSPRRNGSPRRKRGPTRNARAGRGCTQRPARTSAAAPRV